MKLSTVKLLMPMIAVSIQANSATTVIPPYLDHMQIPVALIGTLISIGPVLALLSRLPVGMAYNHGRGSNQGRATGYRRCDPIVGFGRERVVFRIRLVEPQQTQSHR